MEKIYSHTDMNRNDIQSNVRYKHIIILYEKNQFERLSQKIIDLLHVIAYTWIVKDRRSSAFV